MQTWVRSQQTSIFLNSWPATSRPKTNGSLTFTKSPCSSSWPTPFSKSMLFLLTPVSWIAMNGWRSFFARKLVRTMTRDSLLNTKTCLKVSPSWKISSIRWRPNINPHIQKRKRKASLLDPICTATAQASMTKKGPITLSTPPKRAWTQTITPFTIWRRCRYVPTRGKVTGSPRCKRRATQKIAYSGVQVEVLREVHWSQERSDGEGLWGNRRFYRDKDRKENVRADIL